MRDRITSGLLVASDACIRLAERMRVKEPACQECGTELTGGSCIGCVIRKAREAEEAERWDAGFLAGIAAQMGAKREP